MKTDTLNELKEKTKKLEKEISDSMRNEFILVTVLLYSILMIAGILMS